MLVMPTMNIKDPEVHRMAHELARRRGTSATGAVREALREALERERSSRVGMAERLMEIGRRASVYKDEFLTDDDMYDEQGLPK
jgi:antitoxin VapB